MRPSAKINSYDTRTFTEKFMPSDQIRRLFKGEYNDFFIVRVQDMYRHVSRPVPPSKASNHTLIYLTAGEAYMRIGSELYTIGQDQMLIVPAGQIFSFEEYRPSKFNKGYLCHFNEKFVVGKLGTGQLLKEFEFLNIWGDPRLELSRQSSSFIQRLLQRLHHAYAGNGLNDLLILQSYLIAFLCEIRGIYQPAFVSRLSAGQALTNKFRELLSRHIKNIQQVSGYAARLHVTPNHLNKAVRSVTGKSPTKWIDQAILLEAKVLLGQTGLPVAEISSAIGIEDPSYFSRLFKKYEGMTPLQFRKRIELS